MFNTTYEKKNAFFFHESQRRESNPCSFVYKTNALTNLATPASSEDTSPILYILLSLDHFERKLCVDKDVIITDFFFVVHPQEDSFGFIVKIPVEVERECFDFLFDGHEFGSPSFLFQEQMTTKDRQGLVFISLTTKH